LINGWSFGYSFWVFSYIFYYFILCVSKSKDWPQPLYVGLLPKRSRHNPIKKKAGSLASTHDWFGLLFSFTCMIASACINRYIYIYISSSTLLINSLVAIPFLLAAYYNLKLISLVFFYCFSTSNQIQLQNQHCICTSRLAV